MWRFIYRLYRKIETFISYAPILWNDADWDQYYLLHLMEHKLKRMSDYHKTDGVLLRADRTAKELLIASELCRRLKEDDIYEEPIARHFDEIIDRHGGRTNNFLQDLKKLDKMTPQDRKKMKLLYEKARQHRKSDIQYLTLMFNKHLDTWWD